jgi:hypothetical protein
MVGRGLYRVSHEDCETYSSRRWCYPGKGCRQQDIGTCGRWIRAYKSWFRRDHKFQAEYHATSTGNTSKFTGGCCDVLCDSDSDGESTQLVLDFLGPSKAIYTTCPSSLNALHLSCQTLRNHEADMVSWSKPLADQMNDVIAILGLVGLVAGCNIFFNADAITPLTSLHFLGPDSVSYSFDHRVNGYVRGEGLDTVIVKQLSDALRDGETIGADIRATGVNQDGQTPSITLASSKA